MARPQIVYIIAKIHTNTLEYNVYNCGELCEPFDYYQICVIHMFPYVIWCLYIGMMETDPKKGHIVRFLGHLN